MRKKIAWIMNITNIGVLSFLVAKNFSPVYAAIACSIAALTILIATIPEALTPGVVYNDEI